MRYFVYRRKNEGLFSKEQLAELPLQKDDLVRVEGTEAWLEAEKIPDLADLLVNPATAASEEPIPDIDFDDDEADTESSQMSASTDSDMQEPSATQLSETGTNEVANASTENALPSIFGNSANVIDFVKRRWPFCVAAGVVLLALVMVASNPSQKKHYPVVEEMVETSVGKIEGGDSFGDLFDFFGDMFPFGDMFSTKKQVAKQLFNDIDFHSCGLFSYCSVDNGKKGSHWITFGLLGHVFSLNQDDLDEHMERIVNPQQDDDEEEQQPKERRKHDGDKSVPQDARPL